MNGARGVRAACAAALYCNVLCAFAVAQHGDRGDADRVDLPPDLVVPPATVRTPAEELATFRLQPGFTVELVASEPLIGDPVQAVFDAAGRLWVVEMRSYMRDVDATGERTADGRITVLLDRDGDGAMDAAVPFLDGLVLPRAVLPLRGGALVLAPPDLLWAEDGDGDLRAERTEVVCSGFDAGLQNPEHCGNGLLWGLDDRIHIADDARMLRWQAGENQRFVLEAGAGGGQWGISQDDRGRLYFNYNEDWLRCDLVPGRYAARHPDAPAFAGLNHRLVRDPSVWPIHVTPGVNRGGRDGILKDGTLVRHTAVCAPLVYRGDLLRDCDGDAFVCEPAGNLVRRFHLDGQDGPMTGANAYDRAEFMASTDERFRPVNLSQGPDGSLYLVDMYRGVIQHRNFVTTFLRRQIVDRGLERPTGMGRIWRIASAATGPGPTATGHSPVATGQRPATAALATADTAALVATLADRDGWRRDTAQRLLVQRQDGTAVPALRALLRADRFAPAHSHALAVLRSLQALTADDLRRALHDDDRGVLAFALGLAPPFLQRGDAVLWSQCEMLAASPAASVRWHLALALGDVAGRQAPRAQALLARVAASAADDAVLVGCVADSAFGREPELVAVLAPQLADPAGAPLLRALARAVGQSRDALRQQQLLQRAAACMQTWQQEALLQGLCDALPKDAAARRGYFVFAATPPALAAIARTGAAEVAPLVQRVLAATELRVDAAAAPAATPGDADLTDEQRARVAAGARVYGAFCAACHQPNGRGMAGLAPPLRDSEWVAGEPERVIRIALHGLRGPLSAAGVAFDGEMPGQSHLPDEDLAAALSWLRRAWGHRASVVAPGDVAAVRTEHQGRTSPWPAAELAPR